MTLKESTMSGGMATSGAGLSGDVQKRELLDFFYTQAEKLGVKDEYRKKRKSFKDFIKGIDDGNKNTVK
jgi:hypothetical protein